MEKKKRRGAVGTAAVAGVALLLAGGFGFGGGAGLGQGEALPAVSDQVIEQPEDEAVKEETAASVTIEVKQDEYMVDGKSMTLGEIESLIHQTDMYQAEFVLVDNYASAKAWDDITGLMVSHGISVVEQ